MSRFESRLLAEIERRGDRAEGRLAALAWAAYRARIGDTEAARRIVIRERAISAEVPGAQIFAHINYVEGLCQYFEQGIDAALEKFLRASALAAGCPKDDCLPLLIFGWLAGLYRNQGRWKPMVDNLLAAADRDRSHSPEVHFRVCLVSADIMQEVGLYSSASDWYTAAREQALAIGDDAALSAMLYNRAAIRVFNARVDEAMGNPVAVEESHLALQASSAQNYTQYIRDQSMRWGFDLMAGQLHMLRGDYSSALALFESDKFDALKTGWPNVDCVRQADILRCRAQIGDASDMFDGPSMEVLLSKISSLPTSGDRAIALHSVATAMKSQGIAVSPKLEASLRMQMELFSVDRHRELEEFSRFSENYKNPSMLLGASC